jgi:hypothetical protein
MSARGFYLVSDFHADMNKLADPAHWDGWLLHESRANRVNRIFNWIGVPRDRILVFAGDTSNSAEVTLRVVEETRKQVDQILICPGNHEYYHPRYRPMSDVNRMLRHGIERIPGVTLMEPGCLVLQDGVLYLGCTGWYDWNAIPELDMREEREMWNRGSNDSRAIIYDEGYPDILAWQHRDWLLTQVQAAQDNDAIHDIVIFTHTVPRIDLLVGPEHPYYKLNGSYGNSLMEEVPQWDTKKKIRVWAYGHTHYSGDRIIDGIRYVCNARGYAGESHIQSNWKPKWIGLT